MKIIVNNQTNKVTNFGDGVIPSSEEQLIDKNVDLTVWKGYKIVYNSLRKTFEKIDGFQTWNNSTRIEHPADDLIGYNTEENRLEFYIKLVDTWYFLWSEYIAITPTPLPPYFLENFETGWLIEGTFTNIFNELFETEWFIINSFSGLFIEDFQGIDW